MVVTTPALPEPLDTEPPPDCFCDLVLNGGVASGVVYPWAILELARRFRFRHIGGNSVGAMAAAVAAAAEYGRCHHHAAAFEPLRRAPADFAEEAPVAGEQRTGMLRLFQPAPQLRGLFELVLIVLRWAYEDRWYKALFGTWSRACRVLSVIGPALLLVLAGLAMPMCTKACAAMLMGLGFAAVLAQVEWLRRVFSALRDNGWGLCRGRSTGGEEAIMEWLHRAVQLSAGRARHDPPLTFADLWFACAGTVPAADGGRPPTPSIDLQMFSTLVSLGRPVRWPLDGQGPRLFYKADEWAAYFPPSVMAFLEQVSRPYAPTSESDPLPDRFNAELREIPCGELPIVVAARMSLSFPLLFSCVPVHTIDYEPQQQRDRQLRRAWMTDGGLCTNFPIHLFDAALPRWPTFGLMLSRRVHSYEQQALWLPRTHRDGRADDWDRKVPDAADERARPSLALAGLWHMLKGMAMTTLNWNDALTARLPNVRNRVLRMALRPNEGQLNLVMPGARIWGMAQRYGYDGGRLLVRRYARRGPAPRKAWREHLYVRAITELRSLRAHVRGFNAARDDAGHSMPMDLLLDRATRARPLRLKPNRSDPAGRPLTPAQARALKQALAAVATLERELARLEPEFGPYAPEPEPTVALRTPI